MITQREYLRRRAYQEYPTISPAQIEQYIKDVQKEHPEWDLNLKVNADTGLG